MRRHAPALVDPADTVRDATDRQLGIRSRHSLEQRVADLERIIARHELTLAAPQVPVTMPVRDELPVVTGPPSIAVQTAAGSTATATITGNDEEGIIVLVPGGAGIATGVQVIVTFGLARPGANFRVNIQPFSAAARTAGATVGPTNRSSSGWSLTTGTALSSGSTYQWLYSVGKVYG